MILRGSGVADAFLFPNHRRSGKLYEERFFLELIAVPEILLLSPFFVSFFLFLFSYL